MAAGKDKQLFLETGMSEATSVWLHLMLRKSSNGLYLRIQSSNSGRTLAIFLVINPNFHNWGNFILNFRDYLPINLHMTFMVQTIQAHGNSKKSDARNYDNNKQNTHDSIINKTNQSKMVYFLWWNNFKTKFCGWWNRKGISSSLKLTSDTFNKSLIDYYGGQWLIQCNRMISQRYPWHHLCVGIYAIGASTSYTTIWKLATIPLPIITKELGTGNVTYLRMLPGQIFYNNFFAKLLIILF